MEEKQKSIEEKKHERKRNDNFEFTVQMIAIVVLVGLLMYNVGQSSVTGGVISVGSVSASEIIPTGVPKIYGEELGISYNYVSPNNPQLADQTINVLANIDMSETLTGDDLKRYISIASKISCEYCCGADSIIFSNGQPACGCAHSYAMRGLAKYLILFHRDEFTDDEILEEIGKWKVLFFPEIHEQKAQVLKSNGIELNYINLASNKYRGIEQGASTGSSGGMVGGC